MPVATIIQLIAQVGIPAATKIIERYTQREPDDVTAAEWLSLLKELRGYNELRAEKVKLP
jgi:hypothetical protein